MNDLAPEWIEVPEREAVVESAFAEANLARSGDEHHWLEVVDLTPHWRAQDPDWNGIYGPDDDHWEIAILHPADCSRVGGWPSCAVGVLIEDQGVTEVLGPIPEFEGRWRIQFAHEVLNLGGRGVEHDVRIEWVDDPWPKLRAV